VIPVRFLTPLDTRAYKPGEFVVLNDFIVEFKPWASWLRLTVPRGFITDFASVPKLVRLLPGFDVNGDSRDAAVLHDFAYSSRGRMAVTSPYSGVDMVHLTRAECDRLLFGGLIACGYTNAQADLFYAGVRAGGWWYWRKRRYGIKPDFDFVPDDYWSQPCTHCAT
jgi:hypothetical protein